MYIVLKMPGCHPGWLERIRRRCIAVVHSRSKPEPNEVHPFTQTDDESSARRQMRYRITNYWHRYSVKTM